MECFINSGEVLSTELKESPRPILERDGHTNLFKKTPFKADCRILAMCTYFPEEKDKFREMVVLHTCLVNRRIVPDMASIENTQKLFEFSGYTEYKLDGESEKYKLQTQKRVYACLGCRQNIHNQNYNCTYLNYLDRNYYQVIPKKEYVAKPDDFFTTHDIAKLTKDDLIRELLSRNHSLKHMSSFNKAELLDKLSTMLT